MHMPYVLVENPI